ncbi:MAG: hypothetical protein AUJ18_07640 [Candidatus Hydrogenedentes bacterium CG1_02_42_14]|nr:MAG: hypothetical protein AUJ18_07640 [Candidatus Hydrogenedentes bacterium CG1_02_42_14]
MLNPNLLQVKKKLIHPKSKTEYTITAYDRGHDSIILENRFGFQFETSISNIVSAGYEIREEA